MDGFINNVDLVDAVIRDCCQELVIDKSLITGEATGFLDFDYLTGGLQKGDFYLLAGPSFSGKTALALCIADRVSGREKKTVAYFSPGKSSRNIMTRLMSIRSGVRMNDIINAKVDEFEFRKLKEVANAIKESCLYLDDSTCITVDNIKDKCNKLKECMGLGLIVVDGLQFLNSDIKYHFCNDLEKRLDIVNALKELAINLCCPVLVLSRFEEPVNFADSRRPNIIEMDTSDYVFKYADIVAFLNRNLIKMEETGDSDIYELIVAKNRSGKTGFVNLRASLEYSKFVNILSVPEDSNDNLVGLSDKMIDKEEDKQTTERCTSVMTSIKNESEQFV